MLDESTYRRIKKEYGFPAYIFDSDRFCENYRLLTEGMSAAYAPYRAAYSYKTNYTPRIVSLVRSLGGMAEVVSGMEYALARRVGNAPENILFNGPCKGKDGIAALLDGAGHLSVLLRVYVPLSKPSIATVTLFSMVGHWNSWFDGMIYLRDDTLQPLATLLHNMVSRTTLNVLMETTDISVIEQLLTVTNESLKSAQLFIGMLSILCVYPFIQKYFTKGLVIGSVKG